MGRQKNLRPNSRDEAVAVARGGTAVQAEKRKTKARRRKSDASKSGTGTSDKKKQNKKRERQASGETGERDLKRHRKERQASQPGTARNEILVPFNIPRRWNARVSDIKVTWGNIYRRLGHLRDLFGLNHDEETWGFIQAMFGKNVEEFDGLCDRLSQRLSDRNQTYPFYMEAMVYILRHPPGNFNVHPVAKFEDGTFNFIRQGGPAPCLICPDKMNMTRYTIPDHIRGESHRISAIAALLVIAEKVEMKDVKGNIAVMVSPRSVTTDLEFRRELEGATRDPYLKALMESNTCIINEDRLPQPPSGGAMARLPNSARAAVGAHAAAETPGAASDWLNADQHVRSEPAATPDQDGGPAAQGRSKDDDREDQEASSEVKAWLMTQCGIKNGKVAHDISIKLVEQGYESEASIREWCTEETLRDLKIGLRWVAQIVDYGRLGPQ